MKACPKSLGIKDGGVLAFRFRGAEGEGTGIAMDEDEDEDEWEYVTFAEREGERFVVEWPSYDETYGEPEPPKGESMGEE